LTFFQFLSKKLEAKEVSKISKNVFCAVSLRCTLKKLIKLINWHATKMETCTGKKFMSAHAQLVTGRYDFDFLDFSSCEFYITNCRFTRFFSLKLIDELHASIIT
jgi:hypothetical protein